ncbi:MAG: chemotaxis protein [Eubacterium sp.]|nr:chemotaxis protein [Eubacterium sp.]
MPIGDPKKQTIATGKYQKKVGLITKSYKLKKEVTEVFAEACEKAGVSQAGQLTKMMKAFIEEQNS